MSGINNATLHCYCISLFFYFLKLIYHNCTYFGGTWDILVHIYNMELPSQGNWGIHHLTYLSFFNIRNTTVLLQLLYFNIDAILNIEIQFHSKALFNSQQFLPLCIFSVDSKAQLCMCMCVCRPPIFFMFKTSTHSQEGWEPVFKLHKRPPIKVEDP